MFPLGHASKNAAGQLASALRSIHFGYHVADASSARAHGLPVSAFARAEPMSDLLNATLWNPYYLISSIDPCCRILKWFVIFSQKHLWCLGFLTTWMHFFGRKKGKHHQTSFQWRLITGLAQPPKDVSERLAMIPWNLRGFLLLNLTVALTTAAQPIL